jgi:hypothetical protein
MRNDDFNKFPLPPSGQYFDPDIEGFVEIGPSQISEEQASRLYGEEGSPTRRRGVPTPMTTSEMIDRALAGEWLGVRERPTGIRQPVPEEQKRYRNRARLDRAEGDL